MPRLTPADLSARIIAAMHDPADRARYGDNRATAAYDAQHAPYERPAATRITASADPI
jgi:hypothetical protein